MQTCIRGSQNVKRTLFIVSSTEGTQNLFSAQKAEADLLSSLVTVVTLVQSVWPGTFWPTLLHLVPQSIYRTCPSRKVPRSASFVPRRDLGGLCCAIEIIFTRMAFTRFKYA